MTWPLPFTAFPVILVGRQSEELGPAFSSHHLAFALLVLQPFPLIDDVYIIEI